MQKIYNISCCGECPAFKMLNKPYCMKIDGVIGDEVDDALLGFPQWCPLPDLKLFDCADINFKKEVKQVVRIVEGALDEDNALAEASHYLNFVFRSVKEKEIE